MNALRVALRIISGKDIFICSSETPAGVSELLFHGRGNFREHLQESNAKAARPDGLAAFMLIKIFYSTSSSAKIHSTSLMWEPLRE